ncbi:MAG: glutathione-disulfide reductase [Burkholderiaceae bacterium]|nr:glutathione-disulfide reductase [Burkholderiaceae bacterium]
MADVDFDLFVIGGGSGGVRAARMAAQRGVRVALAEVADLGGTCVNAGCIPKKLYSYAAHYAEAFEEAPGYGWTLPAAPTFDWNTLKANRAREIERLNGIYLQLLQGAGVTVLRGGAQLAGGNAVTVNGQRHTARHILVATGGQPFVPEVAGRELAITSEQMFDLDPFPRRLLVVGGGYIACEMASIFNALGSKVSLVQRGPRLLGGFDADAAAFVASEMGKAGVDVQLNASIATLARQGDGCVRATLGGGTQIDADAVLYATGRRPNTAGIGLEEAGVKLDDKGSIMVDTHFRTSAPGIYALGDVSTKLQLTPVALAEAMVLVDELFGPKAGKAARSMDYDFVPSAVFTHPNLGTVGFTEEAARETFGDVTVFRTDFKPLKHTLSGSAERVFMKLVVETKTDRVVGLHMVGADAGEIVQGFAVAMRAGATKAVFDSTIGIHPTAAEEFVTMREPSPSA